MKQNAHSNFAGVEQLDQFENWTLHSDWLSFHANHYDWWMFPYDEPSSQGFCWTVYETDVLEVKQNPDFVKNYLRGVKLLLLAWGWQLQEQRLVEKPGLNLVWAN
ncbi:hypothetical protein [Spirosoma flavum]|uniref:Uncharacterized protein n=1 Tax=Spirosoma flavum TaxID=2048557 RepID=A0ABW6ALR9_9BACT